MAKKANVSRSFLSDLENGKRNIGADKLPDIARALSLSLDYQLTGKDADAGEALPSEVQIPISLANFAADHGISFRKVMALMELQKPVVAHLSSVKKGDLEKVDGQQFYEAVKRFL